MSVFMDLNVLFSSDRNRLQSVVETAAHLGFSTIAINYVFEPTTTKKQEVPVPCPINELIDQLPVVQGRSRPIRVLNRLTVVMSDSSHFVSLLAEAQRRHIPERFLRGLLFGLSDGDAKEAVSSTCRAVLLHAETRRTASGIVYTSRVQQEALHQSDCDAPAAKRTKADD
ncbi:ribonuclease P protein subunit p30 [Stegastes partitus]|uniref:Ribonuclease P protein subunit p30 n=1 Tax=Stegastes partitus TaxID=144197 RepID=A0A9Y4NTG6_9TELE|nr:PREDICTED: ribonuclease P protein subunit p30 [Stegastes partitus]